MYIHSTNFHVEVANTKKDMRTLPYDYSRCMPKQVDDKCKNCKRWWHHPEQTLSPFWQSVVDCASSSDAACHYIPISLQEKK
jgi:hypothetical protein